MDGDNEMEDLINCYNNKVNFYKDFLAKIASNPGKDSVNRYLVQNKLLTDIKDTALKAGLDTDVFIKNQVQETTEALKNLGVRVE